MRLFGLVSMFEYSMLLAVVIISLQFTTVHYRFKLRRQFVRTNAQFAFFELAALYLNIPLMIYESIQDEDYVSENH